MNSIFRTILLAVSMATTVASFAAKEFKKEFGETYDITEGAKVELFNKYGNIRINTHSKNEVSVRVEVIVDARSEEQADDVFERIDIDFFGSKNHVKVETSIGDQSGGGFWKKWNSSGNYQINYYVDVPTHVFLRIKNKYGNVTAEDMDNDIDIEVKYGNFDIGDAQDLDVYLGYGNGTIGDIQDLDMELKYGKLYMDKAQDVDIESKYSEVVIKDAQVVNSESKYDNYKLRSVITLKNHGKYDDFNIGSINNMRVYSKYTGIDVESLGESAIVETGYGHIRIDELSENLQNINIDASYTGIRIYNPDDVGFEFDIKTEYADITIDEGSGEFGDDDEDEWARGKRKGKGKGKIVIRSRYGDVKIR